MQSAFFMWIIFEKMYGTYTGGIWEILDNIQKRSVRSLIFDTAECSCQDRERQQFYFKHQKSTI